MYIVAYDITDDRERRKVSRVLDGYGYGVQRSVYVCHIGNGQAKDMLTALKKLDIRSGFLLSWKVPDSTEAEQLGNHPPGLPLKAERVTII